MTRKSLKIGRYTEEEIFQYMTDVEGSMLGRSMYDAIFNTIHALITEKNQLKKDNETLQKHYRTAEKLQRELDCALKLLSENPPCERDGFMDNHTDYCSLNCGVDEDVFKKCWLMYIDEILERTDK